MDPEVVPSGIPDHNIKKVLQLQIQCCLLSK